MKNFRSLRITTKDDFIELADQILTIEGFHVKRVDFYKRARICISDKIDIGNSILNRFGHIYIQDLSSMLPPLLLSPKKGSLVLDLCASPGGKSAILSELVGEKGLVVANEPERKRYVTLQKNIERLNLFNVVTTSYRGEDFPESILFDYILLDVPCSGWGTVDKNPRVMRLWKGKRLEPLINLQKQLIKKAYKLLKPGGKLIYSTCTTNPRENQEQINWALNKFSFDLIFLQEVRGFVCDTSNPLPGTLAIKGHEYYSQGFFIASLKKSGSLDVEVNSDLNRCESKEMVDGSIIYENLNNMGLDYKSLLNGFFYKKNDNVFYLSELMGNLRCEGIFMGRLKKGKFMPNLKLWKLMDQNKDNVMQIDDLKKIKKLLSGESFNISTDKNYLQLFFKEIPLCLVAVKNGRVLITK